MSMEPTELARIKSDYINTFTSDSGINVLKHLYQTFCGPVFDPNDSAMAYKAGQHDTILTILQMSKKIGSDKEK